MFPASAARAACQLTAPAGVTDVTGSRREGFYLLDARRNFKKDSETLFLDDGSGSAGEDLSLGPI